MAILAFINIRTQKMAFNFKSLVLLAAISFSSLSVDAQQKQSSLPVDSASTKKLVEQALKDISYQDFKSAENNLKEALNADEQNLEARLALIRIYFLQKRFPEAESLAQKGTQLDPSQVILWQILVDVNKESKNYKALIPLFDQLIILEPDQLKNYLDKAFTYSLLENYKAALEVYNLAEKKYGEDENIYSGRSSIYLKQNKSKVAIKELETYLQKHDDRPTPYLMLSHLYLDLKEPKLALKELATAEAKFPDQYDIYLTKADAYQQLKDDKGMLLQLEKAFSFNGLDLDRKIKIIFSIYQDFDSEKALSIADVLCQVLVKTHPTDPKAYAVFGDILIQQGKNAEALVEFKKALKLNPRMDILWENVLQIEIGAGQYALAQKDGEQALQYAPQNAILLLFTGYSYLLNKEYEKSRPFIEGALNNADPKNDGLLIQIYSALGDLYNALKMVQVSNVAYDEALTIDSNNTYVLNNYAYYLSIRKDNLEKAARYSKRSNELQPGNSSFQDTYAWVLFQQENYQDALIWIDKALKSSLDPSPTLLEHQGDILSKLGKEPEAVSAWQKAKTKALESSQNIEKLDNKIKNKKYVD